MPAFRPRRLLLGGLLAAALVAAAVLGLRAQEAPYALLPEPALSLLAIGDAGAPPGLVPPLDAQRALGRALAREDRRAPADALVFLGDNFYETGLARPDLVARVRANLTAPFCRFVALDGPRSAEVRGACPRHDPARPRPSLYAVLGNHDARTGESRQLETREVSQFISNWRMPAEAATAIELGSGVSLILFDSNRLLGGGDPGPLRDALRASRGPWRILAAHHPIGTSRDDRYAKAQGVGDYGARVLQAIREARVEVHVMLAGHEHSLQLVRVDPPSPRLVVISGAGSRPGAIESKSRGRLFQHEGLGFARVDLLRDGLGERLAVTLYAVPRWRTLAGGCAEVLTRWSVAPGGRLLREPLAVRTAGLL